MDLQIGIFCLVIASLSSLVIYIVLSISSIKEDSFEEAKANRRKMIKQYHDQNKSGVDKGKEKKLKKVTKKSKKNEHDDSETSQAAKENEPDVVEEKETKKASTPRPVEETKPQVKEQEHKKSSKAEKSKKNQSSEIITPAPAAPAQVQNKLAKTAQEKQPSSKSGKKKNNNNNNNEEVHKARVEDDVDGSSTSSQITSEEPVKEQVFQQAEVVIVKQVPKPSKKKRSEITALHQLSNDREGVNINLLVSLVQKAELSHAEIQLLIDALLNKQQEDISDWLKGRQDPQVKLQKQLAEMEQALKDEKQISSGFQAKLKELRNEINSDKANAHHTKDLLLAVQNDCKTLSVKLQASIEENQVLTAKIQQCQKQLTEEQLTVHKLKEEQGIQQQLAEKQCHEAVLGLKAQVNQYAAQSQEMQAANNALRTEISMLQENDMRIQEEYREVNVNLERALSAATFDANALRQELANIERALADSRAEIDKLGGIINGLKAENQRCHEQNKQYLDQISTISKENESLKEKLSSENLENGYSSNSKQDIADYEAKLEESTKSLDNLMKELDTKNKKIEELSTLVTSVNTECQKTKSSLEAATMKIAILEVKKPEAPKSDQIDTITQLKNVLNDKNQELASLKSELETCKLRNNELRNKNWKVVEALNKAEQTLQSKIANEQKNNANPDTSCDIKLKTSIQRIVKYVHPEIAIEDRKEMSIDEWLQKAEEALTTLNHGSTTTSNLQSQNSQLQSLVQHYKTIITETEGMLNQLQNQVEVEESKWKEKLHTLEEELDLLKQQIESKFDADVGTRIMLLERGI